jgi:hypothetical protein
MSDSSVTEILPGLWLGDTSAAHNDAFLKDKQIQFIIDCSGETKYPSNPAIKIKHRVHFIENYDADSCMQMCRVLDEYCNIIKNSINSYNILIYCTSGKKFAPVIVIMYLMKFGVLDLKCSLECIESKRAGIICEITNYVVLLKIYQKLLKR